MNLFNSYTHICDCSHCGAQLHYTYGTNVYSGGHFYCGNCHCDVTIDLYGDGYYGYYVKSITGKIAHYQHLKEASDASKQVGDKLYYAHNYYSKPRLVDI